LCLLWLIPLYSQKELESRGIIRKMTLQEKIQSHLTDAMRSKDQLRLSVLRMMKSAVKNKEIEKMKALEESELLAVLFTLVKQRKTPLSSFGEGPAGVGRQRGSRD